MSRNSSKFSKNFRKIPEKLILLEISFHNFINCFLMTGKAASPEGDSGFNDDYSSLVSGGGDATPSLHGLKHTLSTPIKDLFSSPNEKFFEEKKTSHTFTTSFMKKRRLFESSQTTSIFGITFKWDEVIPILVLAFVALSAVVTVTTLTTALRYPTILVFHFQAQVYHCG